MKKGFILVEVMIAILVLTLGIVAVLQIFPLGFNVEKSSQMQTQAVFLGQDKIEEVAAKAYQDIVVGTITESSLASPFEKFSRQTKISYVNSSLQEITSDVGLKKIEVIVSWKPPLRVAPKNIKILTLVAEK